ncbi:MAG: FAD:protein FMN transferase [Bacteroidales bacterium]|jgi:thiamine biosynthesis lipoprotein|nr:FAD:protein FMN transferase [Bacteroidales bacterium]
MKQLIFTLGFILILSTISAQNNYHRTLKLMGSKFSIAVVCNDSAEAEKFISLAVAEIQRIEKIISSWDSDSETQKINQNAGIKPVKVSNELFNLIQRSLYLSQITDGAFDITIGSMNKVWTFDGSMTSMPSETKIKDAVSLVNYENIRLNEAESTVFLTEKGMKLTFGALGKGYAADKAKDLLINEGASGGIINASGDMNTWGKQADGSDWTVAITNPWNKEHAYGTFNISGEAVVTSGDYEKQVEFNGKKFSHIIDPKTGYPAQGITSVTVFSPKAELADALATAIFIMGIEIGIDRINQIPETECIIIDNSGKVHTSNNIKINTQ